MSLSITRIARVIGCAPILGLELRRRFNGRDVTATRVTAAVDLHVGRGGHKNVKLGAFPAFHLQITTGIKLTGLPQDTAS